jgi:hypothetical protein
MDRAVAGLYRMAVFFVISFERQYQVFSWLYTYLLKAGY